MFSSVIKVFCVRLSLIKKAFTSHIWLLPLYHASQLVTHSFVQSPWYLEQREKKVLVGKLFNDRKWFVDSVAQLETVCSFGTSSHFSFSPLHKRLTAFPKLYFATQFEQFVYATMSYSTAESQSSNKHMKVFLKPTKQMFCWPFMTHYWVRFWFSLCTRC